MRFSTTFSLLSLASLSSAVVKGDGSPANIRGGLNNKLPNGGRELTDEVCGVTVENSSVELTNAVNDHRVSKGSPRLPVSIAMIATAQAHVENLEGESQWGWYNSFAYGQCNIHSWFDDVAGNGRFDYCCYDNNGGNPECMQEKPGQVTTNWYADYGCEPLDIYNVNGNEIGHWNLRGATADRAINGWQNSNYHRATMLSNTANTGVIGCAMGAKLAFCWFAPYDPNDALDL